MNAADDSPVVETKGFVPTAATLDAEVVGEIVKEDGTPVASVAPPSEKKPSPKVRTADLSYLTYIGEVGSGRFRSGGPGYCLIAWDRHK